MIVENCSSSKLYKEIVTISYIGESFISTLFLQNGILLFELWFALPAVFGDFFFDLLFTQSHNFVCYLSIYCEIQVYYVRGIFIKIGQYL